MARQTFAEIYERSVALFAQVDHYDRQLTLIARAHEATLRVMASEGVGPLTATALVATIGDAQAFANGRQLAAWLGPVPRQHSTGGKSRQGPIPKRGDSYLSTLFIHGARAALRRLASLPPSRREWAMRLRQRCGRNKAAVALAAKHVRIAWAMLARDQKCRPTPPPAA